MDILLNKLNGAASKLEEVRDYGKDELSEEQIQEVRNCIETIDQLIGELDDN